jgi:hypothetical protein
VTVFYILYNFTFVLIDSVTCMVQVHWHVNGLCSDQSENGTMILKSVMQRVQYIRVLNCEYPQICFLETENSDINTVTVNIIHKYMIVKTVFTCSHNTLGVSSVNYVHLLTRTRKKERQTSPCSRQEATKTSIICHVVVCLALCLFCFCFILRILLHFLRTGKLKCQLCPHFGVSILR